MFNRKNQDLEGQWKFTGEEASFPYYCPTGYFSENEMAAGNWVSRPLDYDLEPYIFFRIEGHIGKDYQTALHQLIFFQSEYSLPFHMLALSASDFAALLHDETKALNGIEHKAGVTKGGTFILVFNDNKSDQLTNKQEQSNKGDYYADLAQSLRELDIPLGEDGEKVIAALDKRYFETNDEKDLLPDQVAIADFYLPYHFDYKQPQYPKPEIVPESSHLPRLKIELEERAFCETDRQSHDVKLNPEGGRLFLDGKEFSSRKLIPSEIGPGEHVFMYELENHRESLPFTISRSLKPSIIIHQINYTAQNEWDIAFASSPTVIYPLGWQLDQYQYNDDNKEGQGIFRRTFNPHVGEMRVSLEINCRELLEALRISGIYTKTVYH